MISQLLDNKYLQHFATFVRQLKIFITMSVIATINISAPEYWSCFSFLQDLLSEEQ